jgi:hypothetical protein
MAVISVFGARRNVSVARPATKGPSLGRQVQSRDILLMLREDNRAT